VDRRRPRWRRGGGGGRIGRRRAKEIERDSSDSRKSKSQRAEGKEAEVKVPERIDEEFCIDGEGWRWLQWQWSAEAVAEVVDLERERVSQLGASWENGGVVWVAKTEPESRGEMNTMNI